MIYIYTDAKKCHGHSYYWDIELKMNEAKINYLHLVSWINTFTNLALQWL